LLTALGVVLELLVVEEQLLPGCEDKVVSAVHTLQHLIDEFHMFFPEPPWKFSDFRRAALTGMNARQHYIRSTTENPDSRPTIGGGRGKGKGTL
jgi:hypothetical protein